MGGAIGLLTLACLAGIFTEVWFDLLGYNRGDGWILLGYMVIGGAALLTTPVLGVVAFIVAHTRPKNLDE